MEFCGGMAVGNWGYTADLISPSVVLYTVCALFFFSMVLHRVGVFVFAGIFEG